MDDPHAIDIFAQMLKLDPSERISARQALDHSYFSKLSHHEGDEDEVWFDAGPPIFHVITLSTASADFPVSAHALLGQVSRDAQMSSTPGADMVVNAKTPNTAIVDIDASNRDEPRCMPEYVLDIYRNHRANEVFCTPPRLQLCHDDTDVVACSKHSSRRPTTWIESSERSTRRCAAYSSTGLSR